MTKNNFNIYFYNTLCSNHIYDRLFNEHNVKSSNAAQTFFKLIAEGFTSNQNVNVIVTSLLPINFKDQKKIFWRFDPEAENNIHYEYIPMINIPIVRNILSNIYVLFKILFKKFPESGNNFILIDFLRFSINISVVLASRFKGIQVLALVTDLPGQNVLNSSLIARIRDKFIFLLKYDYYVCLTSQLNEVVNLERKPSVVIEGFTNTNLQYIENKITEKFTEFVIVYAGGLYERYGVKMLVEAFRLLPNANLRLWLYGFGPFMSNIVEYSHIDDRIQYKGILPQKELMNVLMRATLLINPRPTDEEFTKYSFPSKNLEYMSSGTPLLTTKLPGMPRDHYPYIFLIEVDSIEGIYQGMKNVLSMPKSEIHRFGLAAKEYVLREKNNIKQTAKIINLLKNIIS